MTTQSGNQSTLKSLSNKASAFQNDWELWYGLGGVLLMSRRVLLPTRWQECRF